MYLKNIVTIAVLKLKKKKYVEIINSVYSRNFIIGLIAIPDNLTQYSQIY